MVVGYCGTGAAVRLTVEKE